MKKRLTCLLLAVLLVFQLGLLVTASEGSNVAAEARDGVVRIIALRPDGNYSLGSGFCVAAEDEDPRYIVTNHHVVNDTYISNGQYVDLPAVSVWILKNDNAWNDVNGLDTSQCIACEIVYMDDDGFPDIALLKAAEPIRDRVGLPLLGDDDDVEVGETVYALGYPGTSDALEEDFYGSKLMGAAESATITSGVVSRLTTAGGAGNTRLIQHDATVNHGNSGGPLIDANGAVLGINTYSLGMDASTFDDNASYAVRISYVIDILDDYDIDYTIWEPANNWVLPVIIGGAVLLLVVIILLAVKFLKPKPQPVHIPEPPVSQPPVYTAPQPPVQQAPAYDPRPRLQCLDGHFAGKRFSLNNSVRLGRDPGKNDLVFPQGTQGVSGVHCVLMVDNNTVWLKDLGSTYGTYVAGGRRLAANEAIQLQMGDKFWLGSERELFVIAPKGGI